MEDRAVQTIEETGKSCSSEASVRAKYVVRALELLCDIFEGCLGTDSCSSDDGRKTNGTDNDVAEPLLWCDGFAIGGAGRVQGENAFTGTGHLVHLFTSAKVGFLSTSSMSCLGPDGAHAGNCFVLQ